MCYDLTKDIEEGLYNKDLQTFEQELMELVEKPSSSNK